MLKLVKLQSLVAKCCKMRKIKPSKICKFCILLYCNFRMQYKSVQNMQTLQGYIFRILQHFATKLCNHLLILVCSF
jgi:hypothetical protein